MTDDCNIYMNTHTHSHSHSHTHTHTHTHSALTPQPGEVQSYLVTEMNLR